MRRWNRGHYAISNCVTAALLAACGGSQSPIGVPGTMPQTSALAAGTHSTNYKVVYSFAGATDGTFPVAPLVYVGSRFYGTTEYGGECNTNPTCGTVYRLNPTGHEKVLYRFASAPDGTYPLAGLIDMGGTFYGTTVVGGSNTCGNRSYYFSCGTVFRVTPGGTEKVLHSFSNPPDGNFPAAGLINVNGTLYGTTQFGGKGRKCNFSCGTVFSITTSGTEKVLHTFSGGADGAGPVAPLIEVKGKLYGTTETGGAYHAGTVFSITLGGKEKVLHSFGNGTDGKEPMAGLIDVNGTLYGTTQVGGASNCYQYTACGTVFSITTRGTQKVLHTFSGGADGAGPVAPLIEVKGTLYGTTESGGRYSCGGGGCGTVFSITPSGRETVLHSFGSGTDGASAYAPLTDVDGTLYGTTARGGTYHSGAVFALSL